jgi:hypothetical protein
MLTFGTVLLAVMAGSSAGPANRSLPLARAVTFLSAEVPRWSRENRCYSCHNNGDAARALYRASRAGFRVRDEFLADTTRWLSRPTGWDHNGGDGPISDKRLARVVFTITLETAVSTGWVRDRAALTKAAQRLELDQASNGSWPLEGEAATSSPAAYGNPLTTLLARDCLSATDRGRFRAAIERADVWLSSQEILSVTDASVCLLASPADRPAGSIARCKRSLDLLRRAQSDDGGWGPRTTSPPEVFDTALALLALARCTQSPDVIGVISHGRAFLLAQQQDDGSWIETTRPSGNVSYAQRISTTGWATLALLETSKPSARPAIDPKR